MFKHYKFFAYVSCVDNVRNNLLAFKNNAKVKQFSYYNQK